MPVSPPVGPPVSSAAVSPAPRPGRGSRRWIRIIWLAFLATVGGVIFYVWAVSVNFLYLFGPLPSLERLENPRPAVPSVLYTADGIEIGRYYRENRSPVPLDSMAPILLKALRATEDVRFEEHSGIDPQALVGILKAAAEGDRRGGSTITQQLAKNLYKTRGTLGGRGLLNKIPGLKTLVAKTKEWIVAVQLERTFTKPEIMALYLNTVDFGSNSFGVKVAARTFFGTSPDSLKPQEAAMLVGMLKAPSAYSPRFQPKAATTRRNVVLRQMAKSGYLTAAEAARLSALPIELTYNPESHVDGPLAYYRTAVGEALMAWCDDHDRDLYADGLRFYTTIDSRYQELAEEAVHEQMKQLQNRFDNYWRGKNPWVDDKGHEIPGFLADAMARTPYYRRLKARFRGDTARVGEVLRTPHPMLMYTPKGPEEKVMSSYDSLAYYKRFLHCGVMTMNPNTGQILAWVGGTDFDFFKYDHVKQARRQPGSTFKPFVYLTAIDKGYTPCDRVRDQRVTIRYIEDGKDMEWQPNNVTRSYTGSNMTLRYAMGRSVNSVTAQLTEKVGWAEVAKYAKKVGITSPLLAVPSIGLGSGGDVSIYEMVTAYSTFANGGFRNEPQLLMRVEDRNGNLIEAIQPKQKRVLRAETAWLMQWMLLGTMQEPGGTSQSLWDYPGLWKQGNEIGGKTGTTSNYSDGWYMGVTQDLVTGTWVGGEDRSIHFRTSSTGEGGKTALPVFGRYMVKLYDAGLAERHPFQRPKNLNLPKLNCYTAAPRKPKVDTVATDALLEQLNGNGPPPVNGPEGL